MLSVGKSMNLAVLISTFFIIGCTISSTMISVQDVIFLKKATILQKKEFYTIKIGEFELHNRAKYDICLNEDIFINESSPYVGLEYTSKKDKISSDVPNPPKNAETIQLKSNTSRTFKKILEYSDNNKFSKSYKISISFAFCNDRNRFFKKIILVD
jgi:hypothetical protein